METLSTHTTVAMWFCESPVHTHLLCAQQLAPQGLPQVPQCQHQALLAAGSAQHIDADLAQAGLDLRTAECTQASTHWATGLYACDA